MMEYSEIINLKKGEIVKKSSTSINKNLQMKEMSGENKVDNKNLPSSILTKTKDKIMNIKNKFQNSLQYPIDRIFEYIISVYSIYDKNEEKEILTESLTKVCYLF